MSLRASDGGSIARVIPAPADHAARLRAIAWLAGNLARDQVNPILAEAPAEPTPLATIPALPATPSATEPPPASAAAPAEQPPSSQVAPPSSPPPGSNAAGAIVRTEPHRLSSPLLWSVSGSVGPVIVALDQPFLVMGPFTVRIHDSTAWQLEVQRRRMNEHLVIGGTLEGTHSNRANTDSAQLVGVNVFVGAAWHFRLCSLEATIGAGPEAASVAQFVTVPVGYQTELVSYDAYRFALYAKGSIAAAIPVTDSIEALLQLSFHVTSTQEQSWFGASTIGVRYLLP